MQDDISLFAFLNPNLQQSTCPVAADEQQAPVSFENSNRVAVCVHDVFFGDPVLERM